MCIRDSYKVTCTGAAGSASDELTISSEHPTPTATLEQRVGSSGSWSGGDVNIVTGSEIHLKWSSTNATSCSGSGSGFSTSGLNGTDTSITEPAAGNSITYKVTCTGAGGSAEDSLTVTAVGVVTATLEQRIGSDGSWSGDDVTINPGQQINLKWSSTNATSCSATGGGFSASAVSGTDTSITEPTVGNSTVYKVLYWGLGHWLGRVDRQLGTPSPNGYTGATNW